MPVEPPHTLDPAVGALARAFRAALDLFQGPNRIHLMKWLGAGLAFMGINTVFLFLLVDALGLSVVVATFLGAEACTLLRFFVNHYWVFGRRNPTLRACVQYHVANAGAFAVWWGTANVLTILGMHYLLAGIAAVACSTLLSLTTNFFWIWRKRHQHDEYSSGDHRS